MLRPTKYLFLSNQLKKGTVELEGVKANIGFQEGKEDKLFLGGQTLEIEHVVKNFLICWNFVDRHDRRDQGFGRLQAGARIIEESHFQELSKHGNGDDLVIGGEWHGQAELQLILCHFKTMSFRTTTRVESTTTKGGTMAEADCLQKSPCHLQETRKAAAMVHRKLVLV